MNRKNEIRITMEEAAEMRLILAGLNALTVSGTDAGRVERLKKYYGAQLAIARMQAEEAKDLSNRQMNIFGGNEYQLKMAI
jgi:hypothetical protein